MLFSIDDRSSRQNVSQNIGYLNSTTNQFDLSGILRSDPGNVYNIGGVKRERWAFYTLLKYNITYYIS